MRCRPDGGRSGKTSRVRAALAQDEPGAGDKGRFLCTDATSVMPPVRQATNSRSR